MNKNQTDAVLMTFPEDKRIHLSDLQDQSPRTLLRGYNKDASLHHVYIENNKLVIVRYSHSGQVLKSESGLSLKLDWINPDKLKPECCDFEFCTLLRKQDVKLNFTALFKHQEVKQYYGRTLTDSYTLNKEEVSA